MTDAVALLILSLLFAGALIVSILTMLGLVLFDAVALGRRRLARFIRRIFP